MNLCFHKVLLILSFIFSLLISGCSTLEIVDLKAQTSPTDNLKKPPNLAIEIETLQVDESKYNDANNFEQGLAEALRKEGFSKTLSKSFNDKTNVDLLIRGTVSGHFRDNKAKNFFTWWPGAIIFAHSWRGTQYIYDAQADIEVIDAQTEKTLGKFHAESSYELSHKSGNPFPFLGALVVIPGVIKGGVSASPRSKFRYQMYEVTHQNLWKKIAVLIAKDQLKIQSQHNTQLQEKCSQRLNQKPTIGLVWTKFISCQTNKYRLLGQETIESNVVSVYLSSDRSIRVHVANDGRILRWFLLKK
ncbi:MAG: hypothetical protein KAH20_10415 [Methylococcales bacterium]|nr:hypothetical protein [Methylococcales bacterium]